MPIKCPVCPDGVATAKGGGRHLEETITKKITRKWFTCKKCGARTPALVTTTIDIDSSGIKKGQ